MTEKKKIRVCLPLDVPVHFIETGSVPTLPTWAKLTHYAVLNGHLEWELVTSTGQTQRGSMRTEAQLDVFTGAWVTPCIPLTLHDKKERGLGLDFIFCVPVNVIAGV